MEIDYESLPEHMRSSTRDYIEHGTRPGSFMEAVICNDLRKAVVRADYINEKRLKDWVLFFYNITPTHCYGSKEQMEMWIGSGGLHGLEGE